MRPGRVIHDPGQLMGRHRRMGRNRIQLAALWLVRRFPDAARAALLHTAADRHHIPAAARLRRSCCALFLKRQTSVPFSPISTLRSDHLRSGHSSIFADTEDADLDEERGCLIRAATSPRASERCFRSHEALADTAVEIVQCRQCDQMIAQLPERLHRCTCIESDLS